MTRKAEARAFLAGLLTATILYFGAGLTATLYPVPLNESSTIAANPPLFKTRDCLALKDREIWESEVTAEVLQVGKKNYLLDMQPYKRRSKFADVLGVPVGVSTAHRVMEKVDCPTRVWLQEGLPHENKGTWTAWASR